MGKISMPQGKGSQLHNRREYAKIGRFVPEHIDQSRASENIAIFDKDIRQVYQEIFGEALEQYNRRQKRADRKIESYYDHIKKSKNGEKLFYEDVVQWGSKEDFQKPETRERAKEALMKYAYDFEEINPNLKLIGAYIHMDEASPHLHIDYIPVATGYKTGLSVRNSLDRAMKQMGFQPEKESRKNNATKLWKESQRAYFAKLCQDIGLEVEAESKSSRKDLSVDEYKAARDSMIGEIMQEEEQAKARLNDLQKAIEDLESKKTGLEGEIKVLTEEKDVLTAKEVKAIAGEKTLFGGLKGVTYKEFEAIRRTALAVGKMQKNEKEAIEGRDAARATAKKDRAKAQVAEERAAAAEKRAADAEATIDKKIAEAFGEIPQDRTKRLEEFCERTTLDGKSVMQTFREQEEARKEHLRQRRERQKQQHTTPQEVQRLLDERYERERQKQPEKKKSFDLER